MPGETELHRTLKKEACRWLYAAGYTAVAAEVRLRPMGIVDAVGTGEFAPYANHHGSRRACHQTCIIECKQSRGDYLRDLSNDGQMQLCLMERRLNAGRRSTGESREHFGEGATGDFTSGAGGRAAGRSNGRSGGRVTGRRRDRPVRQSVGLGKFAACLMQPFANLHYVLAPAGLIKKKDLPPRWGLLSFGPGGISVVVKAVWQENAAANLVESAIARTLSGDIFRAGERAIMSVNRELMKQQQQLADKIRQLRPFAPSPFPEDFFVDRQAVGEGLAGPLKSHTPVSVSDDPAAGGVVGNDSVAGAGVGETDYQAAAATAAGELFGAAGGKI